MKKAFTKIRKIEKNILQESAHSFRVRMMFQGVRVDKTFDTLAEARAYRDSHRASAALDDDHAKRVYQIRQRRAEREQGYTFRDLVCDYREAVAQHKKGYENSEKFRLAKLENSGLAKLPLYLIHKPEILDLLNKDIGGADANKKRYYNLIHHIFAYAQEQKKLDNNPCGELGKSEIPKDGKPRDRRLVGNEYERLLKHLQGDAKALFILYVETGCRKAELFSLKWSAVNLKKRFFRLHADDTKTGEFRQVALSTTAINALQSVDSFSKKDGFVFGISPTTLKRHWTAAREAAGVKDLRIHDLRHEAASRFFEKGLNILEAASQTGHKSLQMLKRYVHLSPTDIAKKLG